MKKSEIDRAGLLEPGMPRHHPNGPCQQKESRAISGGVWDYVSASRLSLWLNCPLSFKFKYLDRIKTPTPPSLFLGQRVHAGLEAFYRYRQLGFDLPTKDLLRLSLQGWDHHVEQAQVAFGSPEGQRKAKQQVADFVLAYTAIFRKTKSSGCGR